MPSFKDITREIFDAISQIPSVLVISFSRKSLYEKECLTDLGFNPWQINHTLKRLEKGGFVSSKSGRLCLTEKGARRMNLYKLEKIKLNPDKKWDHRWRIIAFDIPEIERTARDALRGKLRDWDCYKIQNSVFVCPFSCERELAAVRKALNITKSLYVFLAADLGPLTEKLRRYYGI